MSNRFLDLCAAGVRSLKPYVPGKPVAELERELGISESIKLASNENPLGPSPRVEAVLAQHWRDLARYPDGGGFKLRAAIAARHGLAPECITLGNGSNDVLDMVARTFLAPGTESLFAQHAFAVYPISSQAAGARLKVVPALAYGHDLDAMAAAVTPDTRVVWVANPNNPTGTWLPGAALRRFAERRLAGLRIGYGLSHPEVADLLNRVRQPFNANLLAQEAALVALDDAEHLRQSVEVNRAGLGQLAEGLAALGLAYIPSVANFLTVDLGRPAGPVDEALLRRGVIVRPVGGYGLPEHLRVSVGLPEENARFLAALEQVLAR
ncbi:MAG: aminotransferase class I/II-fold pyridoxal phosphate-dependent enzyme [Gammaproteobacteria bacterium]